MSQSAPPPAEESAQAPGSSAKDTPSAAEPAGQGTAALGPWGGLFRDLMAAARALFMLARAELHLSVALAIRAMVLLLTGLVLLGLSIMLAAAVWIAVMLAMGFDWPAALFSLFCAVLALGAGCLVRAKQRLAECGFSQTRAQLRLLKGPAQGERT